MYESVSGDRQIADCTTAYWKETVCEQRKTGDCETADSAISTHVRKARFERVSQALNELAGKIGEKIYHAAVNDKTNHT